MTGELQRSRTNEFVLRSPSRSLEFGPIPSQYEFGSLPVARIIIVCCWSSVDVYEIENHFVPFLAFIRDVSRVESVGVGAFDSFIPPLCTRYNAVLEGLDPPQRDAEISL